MITSLGIGEAVVTVMNERGAPTPVAWTKLRAPESLMAPSDADAMATAVEASPRHARYAAAVDRDSARERLAAKLEEGARKAGEDAAYAEQVRQDKLDRAEKVEQTKKPGQAKRTPTRQAPTPSRQEDSGIVYDVVNSGAFKDFMRTAAREVARGMFGSGRR